MPSLRPKVSLSLWLALSVACSETPAERAPPGPDTDIAGMGGLAGAAGAGATSGAGAAGFASGGAGAGGGGAGGGAGVAGAVGGAGAGGASANGGSGGGGVAGVGMSGAAGSSAGSGGAETMAGAGGAGTAGNGGSAGAGEGGMAGSGEQRPARVLLYHFSTLVIPSVPQQLDILENKLESWGYEVDRSEDPALINDETLEGYAAVGMINTCFYPFGENNSTGEPQAQALRTFLLDGGGLFATHCADVTFQSAAEPVLYNQLIGGRASSQYFEGQSQCRTAGAHATIAELPATFGYNGNLDNTNFLGSDIEVLVRCTWGDSQGTDVAVSWVRSEGDGRVFFTGFGKVADDLTHATIGDDHIVAGLAWVLRRF